MNSCAIQLWIVEILLLKVLWFLDLFLRNQNRKQRLWKKVLACAFTDRIGMIMQVQSCWTMLLISAQSKIFLRFICTCRQTMKMLSTFTRNLDLKSQIPSRTITWTSPRLTAIFLQNSSPRQRNNVKELVVKLGVHFLPIYWTLPWFSCTIKYQILLLWFYIYCWWNDGLKDHTC